MAESNINCKHIKELNCPFFDENRLCPNKCPGFVNKNGEVKNEEVENCIPEIVQEKINEKRKK